VQLYLLRCSVEGKSDRTVRAYRETLARFLRALETQNVPLYASAVHPYFREVRCWFNWLPPAAVGRLPGVVAIGRR
jgi:site-specific recombinase XerD